MNSFKGKVAVITGASSGIGLGLAQQCVQLGMRTVFCDINENRLQAATKQFKNKDILTVVADVTDLRQVENVAQRTVDEFGEINLVFNNAGIDATLAPAWEYSPNEFKRVMDVNVYGVYNGIRAFVPIMLEQDNECHIVNTSSLSGIAAMEFAFGYVASKYAVVGMSEALSLDLQSIGSKIQVSVLLPIWVATDVCESIRPPEISDKDRYKSLIKDLEESISHGMSPEAYAKLVFEDLKKNTFYIITDPDEFKQQLTTKMNDILQGTGPKLRDWQHKSTSQ